MSRVQLRSSCKKLRTLSMDVYPRLLLPQLTKLLFIRSTQSKALKQYATNKTEITAFKVVTIRNKNVNKIARLILTITLEIKEIKY